MIKSALQHLIGMGKAELHEENGQIYSDKPLTLIEAPTATPFIVNTLSSLVDYLKSDFDVGYKETPFIVHVNSPTEVTVESPLNENAERDYFLKAEALIPRIHFEHWYDTEEFNIKLQSCFVNNEDRGKVLIVVGNIAEEQVKTIKDDGTSQSVVAQVGIQKGNLEVPNPVLLAPYRTFVEVGQPTSGFIFRMQSGPRCALFEADGGAWKLKAIKSIKDYLTAALKEEIEAGKATVIS